jgi:hypothetical protein
LAGNNTSDLKEVMATVNSSSRITAKEFEFSPDARSGTATADFTPSRADPTFVKVTITYGNGVTESTGMYNMVAFGGPSVWRMAIGSGLN